LTPTIKTNQKRLFLIRNLKPKKGDDNLHSIINNGYQMSRINKNNNSPFLSNNCFDIDKDNNENNGYSANSLINFPFVSVIVPARNEEKYIERCLLSLLSQGYPNFEIIAVDDNSSDNTLKIK
jgi:cellulose synthase/poly-beta-1,6-N-acetylglucosamine synthase-like glycosyltransferase